MSKETFLPVQNALISELLPGSWFPKLLAGNARTLKPLSLYFWNIDSRPEYVLSVNPHKLATLTIKHTSPLYLARETSFPSLSLTVNSWMDLAVGSSPV